MPKHIPVGELEVAVQSAVEQVLGKEGAVPIDKLWVGFVAPENVATQQLANGVAAKIGGAGAVGSVGSAGRDLRIVGMVVPGTKKPGHGIA